jgi:ribosomal protein S18 acetylase RimI-like enzyme
MEAASLGFQTDITLLRLGGSQVEDRGDHLVVRSPHNPQHWWGNFLLLAEVPDPDRSSWWLDRFAAAFPTADHVALGVDGKDGRAADLGWFAARGYDVVTSTVMTANQVHPPVKVNRDARYRRLRSDGDWLESINLHIRCEDRPLEPTGFEAFVTARTNTYRRLTEAGRGEWFGAFLDDRLVAQMGLVAAGPGLARFQAVETDPQYRRLGLAGSLVHHVGNYGLTELQARTLVMVADPDYFAINLYRTIGFADSETQLQIERPPPGPQAPPPDQAAPA